MPEKALHEDNQLSWNAATVAHNGHQSAQPAFFRQGGTKLYTDEMELPGRRCTVREGVPSMPLTYGLVARNG